MFLFLFRSKPASPGKLKLSELNIDDIGIDEAFAASALNASLSLLIRLADLWRQTAAGFQVFQFLSEKLLPSLSTQKLHTSIRKKVDDLQEKISVLRTESRSQKGSSLVPKKPVTMLKLYEPEIEDE